MEENKQNSREYTFNQKKKAISFNQLLAFIAFLGIGCIAIALLLTLIFKGNTTLASAFNVVGQVIAYSISMILAYSWVKTHRHVAWLIAYVIFVLTIVVLFILNITI